MDFKLQNDYYTLDAGPLDFNLLAFFSSFPTLIFFYKNILDRLWEKIKDFCKITFSPKVLKWQKCDIRTSYVTLEKLRIFPLKIHKFSNLKPKFFP